jgi:hypothetical protein
MPQIRIQSITQEIDAASDGAPAAFQHYHDPLRPVDIFSTPLASGIFNEKKGGNAFEEAAVELESRDQSKLFSILPIFTVLYLIHVETGVVCSIPSPFSIFPQAPQNLLFSPAMVNVRSILLPSALNRLPFSTRVQPIFSTAHIFTSVSRELKRPHAPQIVPSTT